MSELKKLVDDFRSSDDRAEAWVAKEMGISRSNLNGWWTRGRTSPPAADLLRALARVTKTPYRMVLDAALLDFGYLPEEGIEHGKRSAEKSHTDVRRVQSVSVKKLDPPTRAKQRRGRSDVT